jgi:ketosteroid isomerase-like protein
MSERNVAIVEAALRAFESDGTGSMEDYFAEDIDHRAIEGSIDDPGPIHGRDELRAYVEDWAETFDSLSVEPVELIDAGDDRVVALLRVSGRAKLSGVETDLTYAVLYTIRNGKIARGREYLDRDQALAAARLAD